jgi:hypothetical protein
MASVGVLSVILDWVRRDRAAAPRQVRKRPDFREDDWIGNEVHVRLGGLDSAVGEHVEWVGEHLRVGDEVVVRVLPPGEFDPPCDVGAISIPDRAASRAPTPESYPPFGWYCKDSRRHRGCEGSRLPRKDA